MPNPAAPGSVVTVRTTSCEGLAVVALDAAPVGGGTIVLGPGHRSGEAVGHFEVPRTVPAGSYTMYGTCIDGGTVSGLLCIRRSRVRR